jgi:N-acetyl-alpha-D-glucosaminyl L-malate synthase BshA
VNVGIVCYASIGGSGILATELAVALADRGHDVHLISTDVPFRLVGPRKNLTFHQVHTPSYPLFREPQYLLSLANRIVRVSRAVRLDIVHAHYAVPHATAAILARQVLATSGADVPRVVTTLHGTDITLIGTDPSYSEIVGFSIASSDTITAVSESLRRSTLEQLGVSRDIAVIPNFLDCSTYRRVEAPELWRRYSNDGREHVILHMSNFRPVKRVDTVIRVFAAIAGRVPARLLLVGDGPELETAERLAIEMDVMDRVEIMGPRDNVIPLLSIAEVMLLPSAQESFGLAALEAMACGTPVVASNVGGLPEVIEDGRSGFLHMPEDVDGMAASAIRLLKDRALHSRIAAESRQRVIDRFCVDTVVPMYEKIYAAS